MFRGLSPTRVGAKSVRNVRSSRLSAVASVRSARTSQVSGIKGLISSKSLKQKSLPLFLRDQRSQNKSSSFRPPSHLLPIQEILSEQPQKDLSHRVRKLKNAIEHAVYADSDPLYRLENTVLTAGDIKKLLSNEDFPVSIIETVFTIISLQKPTFRLISNTELTSKVLNFDLNSTETVLIPIWTDHWSLYFLHINRRLVEIYEINGQISIPNEQKMTLIELFRVIYKEKSINSEDFSWMKIGESNNLTSESGRFICEFAFFYVFGEKIHGREEILGKILMNCEGAEYS